MERIVARARLGPLVFALVAIAAPSVARAQELLLVMHEDGASVAEALAIELADRGVRVIASPAPSGDSEWERAASAVAAARGAGARAAAWVEPGGSATLSVCVAMVGGDVLRARLEAASLRAFAIAVGSMFVDSAAPPGDAARSSQSAGSPALAASAVAPPPATSWDDTHALASARTDEPAREGRALDASEDQSVFLFGGFDLVGSGAWRVTRAQIDPAIAARLSLGLVWRSLLARVFAAAGVTSVAADDDPSERRLGTASEGGIDLGLSASIDDERLRFELTAIGAFGTYERPHWIDGSNDLWSFAFYGRLGAGVGAALSVTRRLTLRVRIEGGAILFDGAPVEVSPFAALVIGIAWR